MKSAKVSLGRLSTVFLAAGLALSGCGKQPDPVGRLGTGAGEIQLGYPQVVDLELAWEMKRPLQGLAGPTRVFVHLLDQRLCRRCACFR